MLAKGNRMMNLFEFNGKIVIVTGGSRGIGKAMALGFANAGAKVIIAARNVRFLEETMTEIGQFGGEGSYIECDLRKDDDIFRLVNETVKQYGRIDILINNSGISPFITKSEEVTKKMWEEVIQVNLLAPFLLSRETAKIMMKNNFGRIINVASVGGMVGFQRQIAYSATKGAVIQMTKVMAVEWSKRYNITVNAIAPSYIETDLTMGMRGSEKISANLLQRTPMGRFGVPNEIVTAAFYLASEFSSYTTGSVLPVDGGWMAY
jgi:NAD(P)-dependent dehydrogenase (short-subunit alcohol dehydrogenase family)